MSLFTDLETHLDHILGEPRPGGGDERIYCCPYCGKNNLWINMKKLAVHCWTCDYGMGVAGFLAQYHNLPRQEIRKLLTNALPLRLSMEPPERDDVTDQTVSISLGEWLHRFRDPLNPRGELGRKARQYLLGTDEAQRHLTREQVVRYHIRYAHEGRYKGRIMIPVMESGDVVYFVARDFLGRDKRYKYLNPDPSEIKKTAGQVLFNFDRARNHAPVVVVEGVFDAISVGASAVAMLGKTLRPGQIRVMLGAGVSSLLMVGDRDVTIEVKERENRKLRPVFKHVLWAPTPEKKDPGDMSRAEINQLLARAEPMHPGMLGSQPFRYGGLMEGRPRGRGPRS